MLTAIKLLHTAVWTFMVGCIFALPVVGLKTSFQLGDDLDGNHPHRVRRSCSQ